MSIRSFLQKLLLDDQSKQNNASLLSEKLLHKEMDYNSGLEVREENPDDLLTNLRKDERLYDKMLLDDRIQFSVSLKKQLVLSTPYEVVSASDDEADMQIADDIKNMLAVNGESIYHHELGYSFRNMLDNALDAMVYGHKVCEKIFEVENSKIFISNFRFKHSLFFNYDYDEYGALNKLLIGRDYGERLTIEGQEKINEKFIIWTYPYIKDGNVYGDSDLREVYEQFRSKKQICRARNIHLERWGSPIPEVVYDVNSITPSEKIALKNILDKFQQNQYILTPGIRGADGKIIGKFEVKIHEAVSGRSQAQYEDTIDQLDKQITRTMLIPDKLGFSESAGGSYNLAEIQDKIFVSTIEFMHGWIERHINEVIKQLCELNFNTDKYPCFRFAKISDNVKADMIKMLVEAKVIDPREKWIRSKVGIPELSKDEQDELDESGELPKDEKMPVNFKVELKAISQNPLNDKAIKNSLDSQERRFINDLIYTANLSDADLIRQIEKKKIVESGNLALLQSVKMLKTDMKKVITSNLIQAYLEGKISAIEEVKPRIQKAIDYTGIELKYDNSDIVTLQQEIFVDWLNKEYIDNIMDNYGDFGKLTAEDLKNIKRLRDKGFSITGIEQEKRLKAAAMQIDTGIRNGISAATISAKLREQFKTITQSQAQNIARTNMSAEFNTGRMNFFTSDVMKPYIDAYQYQAIIDETTTEFCSTHNNQIIAASDPRLADITPPNHFQCRSVLVAILAGESELSNGYFKDYKNNFPPFGAEVPASATKPAEGFGG